MDSANIGSNGGENTHDNDNNNDVPTMADDENSAFSLSNEITVNTNSPPTTTVSLAYQQQQNSISGEEKPFCRICHGTDEDSASQLVGYDPEWMHPCRCSGTIKWVHRGCFEAWLAQAPYQQRFQCAMCKYDYRSSWRLKPLARWTIPDLKLNIADWLEISLDVVVTYGLIHQYRRFSASLDRSAPFLALTHQFLATYPYFHVIVYAAFVLNENKLDFYHQGPYHKSLALMIRPQLVIRAIRSICEETVQNAIAM